MKKVYLNYFYNNSRRPEALVIYILALLFLLVVWKKSQNPAAEPEPVYDAETGLLFKRLFSHTEQIRKLGNQNAHDKAIIAELSTMLNHAMKKIGQLTCEKTNQGQSAAGGWCSPVSGKESIEHKFDESLALALSKMLKGKHVASFGDGPGIYREKLLEWKGVASYDAFDGAPYTEQTTDNQVKFLELTAPIYHLGQYDWVMSLEVAEHIPVFYESIYVENLKRHAKEGIIMSWARIDQPGFLHVNNRDMDYVIELLESTKEFKYNEDQSVELRKAAQFPWFRSNIVVFNRIVK